MTSIESNWTYDALGRVTDQNVLRTLPPAAAATVARQQLTYFGNDDVQTLRHHLGATSRLFTHTFDRRHHLTKVTTDTTSYFGADYTYGTAGRLASAKHTRTISPPVGAEPKLARNVTYQYANADPEQVTSLTNVSGGTTFASYTYDAAGNQLTRTYPSTTPANTELWEYVYDGKDQLRRATKKVGGIVQGIEEYWYGEAGQRMLVLKRNSGGTKTGLTWFIGDTEAHYDGTGALTKIYSHLSLGTPIARQERTSNTATTLEFQFHGLASHTIAAVAQNGTVNASFSYAPFGEVLEATDGGASTGAGIAVHKRRSNDKIQDDLTGLAYYGARYYDKTLIGWSQADPLYLRLPDAAQLSSPRRANIYAFSLNNALRYVDPDGLDPKMPASGGALSYRSEKEMSEAGRAANMASDGWAINTGTCSYNEDRCSYFGPHNSGGPRRTLTSVPSPALRGGLNEAPGLERWEEVYLDTGKLPAHATMSGGDRLKLAAIMAGTIAVGAGIASLLPAGVTAVGVTGAAAGVASVPLLTRGTGHQMMSQAFEVLRNTPAALRQSMASNLLPQVAANSTTPWAANMMPAANGATAWIGSGGNVVVINTSGHVFTGIVSQVQTGMINNVFGVTSFSGLTKKF